MRLKKLSIFFAAVLLLETIIPSFAQLPQEEPPKPQEVPPQIVPLIPVRPVKPGEVVQSGEVKPEEQKPPAAPESQEAPPGTITLNFVDADIKDLLQTVGELTGESFMYSPGVGGKITVQTSKPIKVEDIFSIFESILEMNGLAAVKTGPFYKIVASPSAHQKSLEILKTGKDADAVPIGDKIAIHVVPLEYVSAGDVTPLISPLLSHIGSITYHPRTNTLLIRDILSNVKKVLELINLFDVDLFKRMELYAYTPRNIDIKSLSKEINDLLIALGVERESKQLIFLPLERLNNLLVFAANKNLLNSVKEWIEKLDKPNNSMVHTYYAKNDKAANLKTIIDQLIPKLGLEDAAGIKILPYDVANSLIIQASQKDFKTISETLKQFDNPIKQVLIDAVIAEVSLNENTQFGVNWAAITGNVFLQQTVPNAPTATISQGISTATTLGGAGISALITDKKQFFTAIQAHIGEGTINILSNPHIMVKNNQTATINVGTDEPTATKVTYVAGTTSPTQDIEYRKTGVTLTVTPNINDGGVIVLDIKQEASGKGLDSSVGTAATTYPTFRTRTANTSVIVSSGQTTIIGGLIEELKDNSYKGIPLLSKIPILGYLFRNIKDEVNKRELVLFLTPHVINSPEEASSAADEFREKLVGLKEILKGKEEKK